ncbi:MULTISPECIES: hypothetical protein [unclassified Methylobacterium]|uniref:hypothetical protein n=1 Tax=unclassified Methylobacterium TaxID=2615210 RepID=UPI0011C1F41E|nr:MULTISPECIES: hypothetical protein [unclassified Methylobacterium]QEE37942.1 hypothetical protein FVA80_02155 [Methylobacterium sp. WL1]TXN59353.1 hypothetical protein FV241_02260 [Methylobacterium sp. WL2]
MASKSRYQRGSMPDVPHHEREPDVELLSGGHFGPRVAQPQRIEFDQVHPLLQEILLRIDDEEAHNLKQGINILVRFEPTDFARLKTVLKLINILFGIGRVIKWSVASFLAGLAAVVLAGEQLQKVWGWVLNALKMVKP